MIQEIYEISKDNLDDLNNLDGIISSHLQYMKEKFNQPEYPLKERLKKGISEAILKIYIVSTDDLGPIGFTVVHQVEGRFSFVLDMSTLEKMSSTKSLELKKAELLAIEADMGGKDAELAKLDELGIEESKKLQHIFIEQSRRRHSTV